jgi:hypothetical protein
MGSAEAAKRAHLHAKTRAETVRGVRALGSGGVDTLVVATVLLCSRVPADMFSGLSR